MRVKDLFEDRKLRRIPVDKSKSISSLQISERKIKEAKKLLLAEFYEQVVLSSYTSMFHTARALLYSEGVQEKSHYAVYIYLREKHSKNIPVSLIESFLVYQNERKELLYGFDYKTDKEDAKNSILDAEKFLIKIKEILK